MTRFEQSTIRTQSCLREEIFAQQSGQLTHPQALFCCQTTTDEDRSAHARAMNVAGLVFSAFLKLGIVLFELDCGDPYRNVFRSRANPDEHAVLAEIDKMHFGRPYRDPVKTCLTGNLHAASEFGNIDARFNPAVVEKEVQCICSLFGHLVSFLSIKAALLINFSTFQTYSTQTTFGRDLSTGRLVKCQFYVSTSSTSVFNSQLPRRPLGFSEFYNRIVCPTQVSR